MTDQQIEDAYLRLGTSMTPPPDVAERVERRVVVRRRRRRTALAGMTCLLVAGSAVLLGGGSDPDAGTIATDQPSGPEGSFVVTRPDGSSYTVDDLTLSCDTTATGEPAQSGRIYLYSPSAPVLQFEAAVARADGHDFTLPFDTRSGSSATRALTLFTMDPETASGADRPDELSSAEPGAAGTVRVLRAACAPEPALELQVDATLGNELQGGAAYTVVGSFG
jgi:hypothetical protein